MADKFLLPCPECDETTAVSASQAGSTLQCVCSKQLEVPTIRQLQQLELAQETQEAEKSEWTAQSGATFLGVLLTLIFAAPGVYLLATWPEPPPKDVPSAVARAEEALADMPVDRAWLYWYNEVELRGLAYQPSLEELAFRADSQRRRWFCTASFIAAGVSFLFLLAVLLRRS